MMIARVARAAGAFALLFGLSASAETVINRIKMGSNLEGSTYAPDGRYAGSILAMDGNDVIVVPLTGKKKTGRGDAAHPDNGNHYALGHLKHVKGDGFYKAFDLRGLPLEWRTPRGAVYVPGRSRLFFGSKWGHARALQQTDELGNVLAPLETGIDFAAREAEGYEWVDWEGMTWLTQGPYAGHIAAIGNWIYPDGGYRAHIYFIDSVTGSIAHESIPTAWSNVETYLCGIGSNGDRLLVTTCGAEAYELSWDGELVNYDEYEDGFRNGIASFVSPDGVGLESIVRDSAGTLYGAGYETPVFRAFSAAYVREEAKDKGFTVGLGVSVGPLAFNSDTGEILTSSRGKSDLYAITPDLRSARFLLPLARPEIAIPSIAYEAGRVLVASAASFPPDGTFHRRGFGVIDLATGALLERRSFYGPPPGQPLRVVPWDATQYLVNLNTNGAPANATRLLLISREAAPAPDWIGDPEIPHPSWQVTGELALSEAKGGRNAQVFDAGEGRRILTGTKIFDASGQLVRTLDPAAIGAIEDISDTVHIGGNRYASLDGDTSYLIVYSIP